MTDSEDHLEGESTAFDLQFVRRYAGNLWRFKWLLALVAAVAVAVAVWHTKRQIPIFRATATFLLDPRPPQILGGKIQEVAPIGTSPWDANRKEYYNAQLQILRSGMFAKRAVELGKLDEDPNIVGTEELTEDNATQRFRTAIAAVRTSITIIPPKEDRVLRISAHHTNPEAAATLVNAHVKAYVDFNLSLRTQGSENAAEWLAKELTTAEKQLRDAELEVFEFKKKNDLLFVSLEDRRNLVSGNIQRYTDAVNDARVKRIEAGEFLRRVKLARQEPLLESTIFDLAGSGAGSSLKQQYYQGQQNLGRLGQTYGPKHPEYVSQKQSIDKILVNLESEADIIVKTAEQKFESLRSTEAAFLGELNSQKKAAFEMAPKEVDYNRLVRQEKSEEQRFQVVLNQLRDSQLTGRLQTVNVRPLDAAGVPGYPVSPSLRKNVTYAGMLALLIGPGLVLLITLGDRRINGPEGVAELVGVPLLGVIPKAEESGQVLDLLVHEQPSSIIAEACRNVRTNLLYAGADKPLRTLMVTSPNEREGKTTTAMYLATVIAQGHKKVLLVESDLRRPRLAKANGVPGKRGLTDLIVGGADYDEVIKTTDVPDLYLLPGGPPPPNPSELLMTERFDKIVDALVERFDVVIFDSPPVLAVTDASIIARRADATVLLVKSEQTLRETAKRAAQQLATVDARVVGTVLNALDLKKRVYGYYGKYGYGYGYTPELSKS